MVKETVYKLKLEVLELEDGFGQYSEDTYNESDGVSEKLFTVDSNRETYYDFAKRIDALQFRTPIGHHVQDIAMDADFPRGRKSYKEYLEYLYGVGAVNEAIDIFKKTYALYISDIL